MTDTLTDAATGTDSAPGYPIDKSMRCPFSPPADLRRLQADAPLQTVRLWDGSTAWLVTRYDELRRRHVAFGYGVHQCLGQQPARVEPQVVYGTLCRRVPTRRPAAGLAELPFRHDSTVYGVYEPPVTW